MEGTESGDEGIEPAAGEQAANTEPDTNGGEDAAKETEVPSQGDEEQN
jgi:hypothetical protein